jgi:ribonuclease G
MENHALAEVWIERSSDRGLVGNIYLGKVQRVLPGMQAAFVDLGLDKAAFLYVGDIVAPEIPVDDDGETEGTHEDLPLDESLPPTSVEHHESEIRQPFAAARERRRPKARIEELVRGGQEILVQVTKDPIGTKGPRVTCNISLPGRHIVFMPTYAHVGISRSISDSDERDRLKRILQSQAPEGSGFVARTIANGIDDAKLTSDCAFLVNLWVDIQNRSRQMKAPALVQPELDLVLKCSRDLTSDHLDRIIIDDADSVEETKRYLEFLEPKLVEKVEKFAHSQPIFEYYGIETEITRAMSRKVWLRSGGYLVIDQAEALCVIDVNTGRFVGRRNLDDTILRANLEAVKEIAYQLRLRNMGGMIIIDFIDMELPQDRERVLAALIEALKKDKARCNVIKISELGLVEMTRQRNRESLERQLCEPCFYCDGRGTIKSKSTIVYEIFRVLKHKAKSFVEPSIVILAHPEVIDMLKDKENEQLKKIEAELEKKIVVRPRGSFHQEQYDVFGSSKGAECKEPESNA